MKQIDRKVAITVELTESEYEAMRLLSERIRNHESYIGGENWKQELRDMIGAEYAYSIEKMFDVHEEES